MPSIQIKQTMGQIAIEVEKAKVEIQQHRPSFQLRSIPARLTIHRKLPSFKLKQNEYLYGSGYKTNLTMSMLRFQKARQRTLEAIERIAAEGDALMRIENKINPIPQLAIQNTEEYVDLQVGMMPRNELEWDTGYINIEWTPHRTDIEWNVNPKPEIVVHPHSVRIYMKRKPSIEITVKDDTQKYNMRFKNKNAGKNVDKRI